MTDELPETPATDAEVAAAIEAVTAPSDTAENGTDPVPVIHAALPFAVDQSHALDALPVGSTATKTTDTAVSIVPHGAGQSEHGIQADDVLHHLPVGSSVTVMASDVNLTKKQIALTLPSNDHRSTITVVAERLHAAI